MNSTSERRTSSLLQKDKNCYCCCFVILCVNMMMSLNSYILFCSPPAIFVFRFRSCAARGIQLFSIFDFYSNLFKNEKCSFIFHFCFAFAITSYYFQKWYTIFVRLYIVLTIIIIIIFAILPSKFYVFTINK